MKRVLAVLLAVMLLVAVMPATSLAAGVASNGETKVYHVQTRGNVLQLRASAGTGSKIVAKLANGTALVKVSSNTVRKNGYIWINVKTVKGQKGWVASNYVKDYAHANVKTKKSGLNVRKGRGEKYKILYSIPHGTKGITVYKINGNWAYVSWKGKGKGWASLSYMEWARW